MQFGLPIAENDKLNFDWSTENKIQKRKEAENIIRSQRDDDEKEDLEFEDFEVVHFKSLFQKPKRNSQKASSRKRRFPIDVRRVQ